MKLLRRYFSLLSMLLGVGAVVWTSGCAGMFQTKQRVLVDAIAAPDAPKPAGQSYRLVIKKSLVTGQPVQLPVIKACIDAALVREGMYEAPPNVPSDVFIEINYGMDTTTRIDASARESFLQLSARANHKRTIDASQEEELWDVRVALTGLAGRLETAMPLLSTVASKYIGTDTHMETILQIADGSPEVSAVRENAVKALSTPPSPQPQTATAVAAPSTAK